MVASGTFYQGAPQLPYTPGMEGVGTVVEGSALAPGTRVRVEIVQPGYGLDGCFAEYVCAPEQPAEGSGGSRSRVEPVRTDLPAEVVAAIGASGSTAKLVIERARSAFGPLEGRHVLILGATGAVGQVLIQLCRLAGAGRVIAAGRDAERIADLRGLGADAVVRLGGTRERQTEAFRDASGNRIDVVLDGVWGEPAAAALDSVSAGAVFVNFGQAAAARADVSCVPLRALHATLIGHSGTRASTADLRRTTDEILEDVADGRVTVSLETMPLERFPEAWTRQAASPGTKLVLRPG
jgi:NADPH2:quinone reductase